MQKVDMQAREKWPPPSHDPSPTDTAAELAAAAAAAATDPLRAKARAVLALLRQTYGEPRWPTLDPLSALIEVLLSHRTADPQTWTAFQTLRRQFPTWEAVREAPLADVEAAIQGTTWPEQKAPRLQAVLRQITAERGNLDLGFLTTLPLDEADAWLQHLPGVGPKSAACVLLFACHRPLLPVDTHVHRVSQRLGLIGPKVTADQAHALIQRLLPDPANAADVLAFHRDMLLHGQRVCIWRDPRCGQCSLRVWCDYYATHPEKQRKAARGGDA